MVNIYTHYSESHQQMYEEYFRPSLRRLYSKDKVKIKVLHHDQTTQSGMFMSRGWLETMDMKLDVILSAIDENFGSWFIFADCDVQFIDKFVEDLEHQLQDVDLVCQEDRGSLCAGFFACKGNDLTKKLFSMVKSSFRSLVNDQVALNHYKNIVQYRLLDKERYFTIGNFFDNADGTHNWDSQAVIVPPKHMLVHHANYVKGVSEKLRLLELIKKTHENLV
jgi:hypothetical protein